MANDAELTVDAANPAGLIASYIAPSVKRSSSAGGVTFDYMVRDYQGSLRATYRAIATTLPDFIHNHPDLTDRDIGSGKAFSNCTIKPWHPRRFPAGRAGAPLSSKLKSIVEMREAQLWRLCRT
jgi:hypothetical protein